MSSERDRKVDEGIIAAGPWKDENCEMSLPYRTVLHMYDSTEAAVHTQIKNRDETTFFEHGNYFPCPMDIDALKQVIAEMERR